ncbi:MAG: ATP-binding protein [Paludibacteraceae bacterium]
MKFLDRTEYILRLQVALQREQTQFLVLYGRRRIGKSTLLKQVLDMEHRDVYFLSDQTTEIHQRMLLAKAISERIDGFDKVIYPDWETLLLALNRQLTSRLVLCLDEFPYMVKSCPSLPSVLQKLLNGKDLRFDLVICGSSQQLMQGYVLNKKEPLYGLANEIIRLTPISPCFLQEALMCDAVHAVEEYAIWGGVPRYWELRSDYVDREMAIRHLILSPQGILHEEPLRLLRDDMRDTIQTATLLSIIAEGANRVSEIAARAGKEVSALSEPMNNLRELGYVRREIPFGESEKNSKKGIYRINDPLLQFYYRFVTPYNSLLELGRFGIVEQVIQNRFSQFVAEIWETLCRQYVSGNQIEGVIYKEASRWWGRVMNPKTGEKEMVELDVVVESLDKKHILLGECKWTQCEDTERLLYRLQSLAPYLPFIKKGQQVHFALFLKTASVEATNEQQLIYLPKDVLCV